MISCKKATQLASQQLDRPLGVKERLSLWLHTRLCGACRRFSGQMRALRGMAKGYGRREG